MRLTVNNRGAAIIEFTIVAMVLFTFIFGCIDFSVYLYNRHVLTNAVREGARAGVVKRQEPRNMRAESQQIQNTVRGKAMVNLISFGNGGGQLTVPPPVYQNNTIALGNLLTVSATFNHSFLILPRFVTNMAGIARISSVALMKME